MNDNLYHLKKIALLTETFGFWVGWLLGVLFSLFVFHVWTCNSPQPWGKGELGGLIKSTECHKVIMASLASCIRLESLLCGVVWSGYHMVTLPFKTGHDESKDTLQEKENPPELHRNFGLSQRGRKVFFSLLLPCSLCSSHAFPGRQMPFWRSVLTLKGLVTTTFPENSDRNSGFSTYFYLPILSILQWVCKSLQKCHKCAQHRWICSHSWHFLTSYK